MRTNIITEPGSRGARTKLKTKSFPVRVQHSKPQSLAGDEEKRNEVFNCNFIVHRRKFVLQRLNKEHIKQAFSVQTQHLMIICLVLILTCYLMLFLFIVTSSHGGFELASSFLFFLCFGISAFFI